MAGQTVIAAFACLFGITLASEKRLLMTDPAYVSQELTHLQSELQELRVKAENQQQTVSALQQTVSTLQLTVTNQQLTVTNQEQNISSQQQAMSALQQTVFTLQQTVTNQQSVITKMTQERFAGGLHYTSPGAAANTLCMPQEPVWGSRKDETARVPAFVYGAEYDDAGMFGMPDTNQDVPCAVCRNTVYSTITMVPGRATCYPGWTEAFHGLLTAGYPEHKAASEYLCVDDHPQATLGGGSRNVNGKPFYAVYSKCGSLPCPPYEDGKTVPCSVCMM